MALGKSIGLFVWEAMRVVWGLGSDESVEMLHEWYMGYETPLRISYDKVRN